MLRVHFVHFIDMNHVVLIVHEIEVQADVGFSRKLIFFALLMLKKLINQFMYTACVLLKA